MMNNSENKVNINEEALQSVDLGTVVQPDPTIQPEPENIENLNSVASQEVNPAVMPNNAELSNNVVSPADSAIGVEPSPQQPVDSINPELAPEVFEQPVSSPIDPQPVEEKPKKKKTGLIVLLVVLLLAIAGGIAFYFFKDEIMNILPIGSSGSPKEVFTKALDSFDNPLLMAEGAKTSKGDVVDLIFWKCSCSCWLY